MLEIEEPQSPHNSKEAWRRLFEQPEIIPDHINKQLGKKLEGLEKLASLPVFSSDTFGQALARKLESHIIYISQEFGLSEHNPYNDRDIPDSFTKTISNHQELSKDVVYNLLRRGKSMAIEDPFQGNPVVKEWQYHDAKRIGKRNKRRSEKHRQKALS